VVGQHLLSGALSGLSSTIMLQPLDLLKTRLQQGETVGPSRTSLLVRITQNIVNHDGFRGLWRGTNASLIRNVPGVTMYMTSVTQLRAAMAQYPTFTVTPSRSSSGRSSASVLPKLSTSGNLVAGAVARVSVGFLLNPFSVLKARYESGLHNYSSLGNSLMSVARQGPSELFRGFVASSFRDAPYAGLFIAFYESIKRETTYLFPGAYAASIHTVSAASAGAVATILTHPFDVVKTKMQVRTEDRYRGFTSTVGRIWTQRGAGGFLDGVLLRMSRKILSSAIGWAVFEGLLLAMQKP